MKQRILIYTLSLLTVLGVVALSAGVANAATAAKTRQVTVKQGETVNGVFIRAAQTVDIAGSVQGDVFLAAETINIDGEINGSAYLVAQTVTIRGKITGNLHVAAGTILVAGPVGGSGLIAGGSVELDSEGSIDRTAMLAGSLVRINGKVNDQVYAAGSTVKFNGEVVGNVATAGGEISVNQGAKIDGNFKYYSKDAATIDNTATITGNVEHSVPQKSSRESQVAKYIGGAVFKVLSGLVILVILLFVAPLSTISVANELHRHPGRSFLAGILFVITVPIVVILSLLTIIGLAAGAILGMMYITTLILGSVLFALWFGRALTGMNSTNFATNIGAAALGLVLVVLIGLIPLVGGLFTFVAFFFGVGALVSRLQKRITQLHSHQKGVDAKA